MLATWKQEAQRLEEAERFRFKNGQAGGRKRESKRTKRIKRGRLSNAMFLFLTGRVVRELRSKDSFLQRKHNSMEKIRQETL